MVANNNISGTPVDPNDLPQNFSSSPDTYTPGNIVSSDDLPDVQQAQALSTGDKQSLSTGENIANKAERAGLGFAQPFIGAAQGLSHLTGIGTETTQGMADWEKQKELDLKKKAGLSDDDWDLFHVTGQVAPWLIAPEVTLGGKLAGAGLSSLAARGAITGLGMGATEPVTSEEANTSGGYVPAKLGQIGTSTLAGAVAGPVGGIASKAIAPVISNAQKVLTDAGVKLTGGQLAGGLSRRLEGIAQDTPFTGSLVRNERQKAADSLQIAVANKALAPIGETVNAGIQPGTDLLQHVGDKASNAYENSLNPLSIELDDPLVNDLSNLTVQAKKNLRPDEFGTFNSSINDILDDMSKNGNQLSGSDLRDALRVLRDDSFTFNKSNDPYQKRLGGLLSDVNDTFEDTLERQVSPDALQDWQNARSSYARYKILEGAASRAGTKAPGVFTPQDLYSASRAGIGQKAKAFASTPMLDIAQAAKEVMPDVVRNSGTPERTAMLTLPHILAHGASYGAAGLQGLAMPAIATAGIYNPVGQAIARHYMTPGIMRKGVASVVKKYLPAATVPGFTYGD